MFARYRLDDVHRFSDPHCDVYRAFGLQRGTFPQLFGPVVWRRAIQAFLRGFGIGWLSGDGFRMPGVFVLHQGQIVEACYASSVADRPDYIEIARRNGSDQEPCQTCVLEATT
jgi:hypothetical protein